MKKILLLMLMMVFSSSLAFGQPDVIGLYSDATGSGCNVVDSGSGFVEFYVIHNAPSGALVSQWSAPKPVCMAGATYLTDVTSYAVIGNSQTGVMLGYSVCLTGPNHVMTIRYFGTGGSLACCNYPVLPDPAAVSGQIEVVDCSVVVGYATGSKATVNGNVSCPCGLPSLHDIPQGVVGGGGAELMGANYGVRGTVGQGGVGTTSSDNFEGKVGYWHLPGSSPTGIEQSPPTPEAFSLEQNYPNPFNPMTTIRFALPKRSHVTLRVYDVKGRVVTTLVDREMEAGVHREHFDAGGLSSGVYFYRIETNGFVQSRKLVVLK